MPKSSLILFAHGSRDPLWRDPLERLAAAVRAAMPDRNVECAYLELCAPSLPDVVKKMAEDGVQEIKILPKCTLPLTGLGVINRIITDLGVLDITPKGLKLVELAPGVSKEEFQAKTGAPIDLSAVH